MRVTNRTRGTVLAVDAVTAGTFFERLKGLLGRPSLPAGGGMVIAPCVSIHTCGMRFPIDAVFFDRSNRVVAALANVRPWRATGIYSSASGVLELPAGTLGATPVEVGDELEFIP